MYLTSPRGKVYCGKRFPVPKLPKMTTHFQFQKSFCLDDCSCHQPVPLCCKTCQRFIRHIVTVTVTVTHPRKLNYVHRIQGVFRIYLNRFDIGLQYRKWSLPRDWLLLAICYNFDFFEFSHGLIDLVIKVIVVILVKIVNRKSTSHFWVLHHCMCKIGWQEQVS